MPFFKYFFREEKLIFIVYDKSDAIAFSVSKKYYIIFTDNLKKKLQVKDNF